MPASVVPGEAALSLLSLTQSVLDGESTAHSASPVAAAGKENVPPQSLPLSTKQISVRSAQVLAQCSPQKHRLLMGRLQSISPSKSKQTAETPPVCAAIVVDADAKQQFVQPRRSPFITISATGFTAAGTTGSPTRRHIRPTPVQDPTPSTFALNAQHVQPVPSHGEFADAGVKSPSPVTPSTPPEMTLLAASMQFAAPTARAAFASPSPDGSPQRSSAPAIQRASSAPDPATMFAMPSPKPAAKDIQLAEQLLRAHSTCIAAASAGVRYAHAVANLSNNSSQSSCSALSRSSSCVVTAGGSGSLSYGVCHASRAQPQQQHKGLPPRCSSMGSGQKTPPVSLTRRTLSTLSGPRSGSSGFTPVRSHSSSVGNNGSSSSNVRVSICIKPLEQIRIKASSIVGARRMSTYQFP
jgi:hypothetical protein